MQEPPHGTLFHTKEGIEWICIHEVALVSGQEHRETLEETCGLTLRTASPQIPCMYDKPLACYVAVHWQFFTKIDLICGWPNVVTKDKVVGGFYMSICATFMDLTSRLFCTYNPHYSCNMQIVLLDTLRNKTFLCFIKHLVKVSCWSDLDIKKFLNVNDFSFLLPSGPLVDSKSLYKNIENMLASVPVQ